MKVRLMAPLVALLGLVLFAPAPAAAPLGVQYALTPEMRAGKLGEEVDEGGGQRHTVRYRPEGKASVTFQQLALKSGPVMNCNLP
jgi:hypothetical protein